MKRTGLLLITGAIAALTLLYVGAAAPAPAPSEIEQLKKEVGELRQRVELLEEHWKDGLIPATTMEGKERPDVINPYPGLRPVPQSWKKGQFNGIPYYIVPIDTAKTPPSAAAQQAPPAAAPAPSPSPDGNRPKP